MSQIHITREHSASIDQAREAADEIAGEMASRFGVSSSWNGDTLEFRHSGINGKIHVSDSEIEIQARLGLLVSPFRKPLEVAIHKYIDEYLV